MTYVIGVARAILPSHRLLTDLKLTIRGCRSLSDRLNLFQVMEPWT
jgi:hypothetical protein